MIQLPGGGDVALDGPLVGEEALASFAKGLDVLRDAVTQEALDADALRERLLGLAALATEAAQAAAPACGALDPRETETLVTGNALIYDRYFGVERGADSSRAQFAAYALAAWADVLADLPETLLGRDEIAALLAGMSTTCGWLGIEAAA